MREMYQNEAEVSPSSPDPANKEVNLNADPFYKTDFHGMEFLVFIRAHTQCRNYES